MSMMGGTLSVLIRKEEDGMWFAQCLEHDVAAQGATLDEVRHRIGRTIAGQIAVNLKHDEEPFANIPKAPPEFWEEFYKKAHRLQAPFIDVTSLLDAPKGVEGPIDIQEDARVFA